MDSSHEKWSSADDICSALLLEDFPLTRNPFCIPKIHFKHSCFAATTCRRKEKWEKIVAYMQKKINYG